MLVKSEVGDVTSYTQTGKEICLIISNQELLVSYYFKRREVPPSNSFCYRDTKDSVMTTMIILNLEPMSHDSPQWVFNVKTKMMYQLKLLESAFLPHKFWT